MAQTSIIRLDGQTIALSVVATSHAAVNVVSSTNDIVNFVSCLNTGAVPVAIRFSQAGDAATIPVDGTPGDFLLPAAMNFPVIISMPQRNPKVTAIGTAAGPSLVYITPVGDQS